MEKTRFFEERQNYRTATSVPYVLHFTFHPQYGIIPGRLSWVGDRVPRDRDEESPDSAGRDAG